MILRKVFRKTDKGELLFAGLELVKLAPSGRHHFYEKQLKEYIADGTVTKDGDVLTMHCTNRKLQFKVDHGPGSFCLHCGADVSDGPEAKNLPQGHADRGATARAHMEAEHAGVAHPETHPAGYKVKSYTGVTLEV